VNVEKDEKSKLVVEAEIAVEAIAEETKSVGLDDIGDF
jgi:hypothetical protein